MPLKGLVADGVVALSEFTWTSCVLGFLLLNKITDDKRKKSGGKNKSVKNDKNKDRYSRKK